MLSPHATDAPPAAPSGEIGLLMEIKTLLKPLARRLRGLPGVSHALRMPTVRRAVARLPNASSLHSDARQTPPWDRVHPFDIEHGTDTSGFVAVADLDQLKHEAARARSLPYAGSQPSIVRAVLATLQPLELFTFVDLGCGKGRPLLVASEYPFREIIGVELSASLAKIAQRNGDLIKQRFPERTPILGRARGCHAVSSPQRQSSLFPVQSV